MTQKEIELLFQDLCARLPYGVKVTFAEYSGREDDCILNSQHLNSTYAIEYLGLKPYLRPLSSMTEEECDMVETILGDENIFDFMRNGDIILKEGKFTQVMLSRLHDYLNSIHVDYRGLIPKGLANKAPEEMYNS